MLPDLKIVLVIVVVVWLPNVETTFQCCHLIPSQSTIKLGQGYRSKYWTDLDDEVFKL